MTAAAKAAGYSRTHVYRVARGDQEVRTALEALEGGRGRRRSVEVTVPSGPVEAAAGSAVARVKDELEESLAARAIEALNRIGIILRAEPDGEVLYAGDQVRAAKVVLDLVRAPAKANVVTARALGPGGASEVTATTTMTAEQRAALAEKMFGA